MITAEVLAAEARHPSEPSRWHRDPRNLRLQFAGVFLLYPGFYIYQVLISVYNMPTILGGFYGVVAACWIPLITFDFIRRLRSGWILLNKIDLLFFALCSFVVIWALIYRYLGYDHQRNPALLAQSMTGTALWYVNYLLFRGFKLTNSRQKLLLFSALFVMFATALAYAQGGFFHARQISESSSDFIASYQGFARSAVLVLFLLLSVVSRRWVLPIYLSGLILLFILGARSEFGGFLAVGFFALFLRHGPRKFLLLGIPIFLVGLLILSDVASEFTYTSRVFRLLDWQSDTSLASRMEMAALAWESIRGNPILGEYGSYMRLGTVGDYAHNLLSAWVGFGIVGFLAFSLLLVYALRVSVPKAWRTRKDGDSRFAFAASMALFSVLLALTAKSMFYELFAVAWGLAGGLYSHAPMSRVRDASND